MNIYFDIGNTNVKINFKLNNEEKHVILKTSKDITEEEYYSQLPSELKDKNIKNVYVCSVVPPCFEIINSMIKKYWKVNPTVISNETNTSLKLDVDNPSKVGADLIALAAFTNSKTNKGIIVNAGTATTVIVVENGSMKGVNIAPGLQLSLDALISGASKLQEMNFDESDNPT